MTAPLCYNYPWHALPDNLYQRIAREYLDWGVDTFVFTDPLIEACLKNPERIDFLRALTEKMGIRFVSMHSPFGKDFDLNIPNMERRPQMIKDHIRAMEIATDFGSKTYTMHVGAYHYIVDHTDLKLLRELANDSLEKLLPTAEKLGIVIAVENSFEPPNSAKEVMGIIKPFLGSPAIGVCYDTGHAHFMAPYPWKDPAKYPESQHKNWWDTGIIEEPNALELLQPHVVTCHIHDNTGYGDLHSMPFDGTIDWDDLMPKLFNCPRMLEYQTEQNFNDGKGWAGEALAPAGGYSIKRQVETFRKLGFEK